MCFIQTLYQSCKWLSCSCPCQKAHTLFSVVLHTDLAAGLWDLSMQVLCMQGNLLSTLKGSAHLVEMLGKGTCVYAGKAWQAILLVPVALKLKCSDSSTIFCQVCDVQNCSKMCCAGICNLRVCLGVDVSDFVGDLLDLNVRCNLQHLLTTGG